MSDNKFGEYGETIHHIQSVELMILKDFIEICEQNNIKYMAYGGTLLGAIRHEGFIPWDDDVDVIMMREDFDKFIEVMDSTDNNKYSLYTMENTEDYFLFLSKFSLNGTEFKGDGFEKTKFKLGISLDIFIFDDVPENNIKRSIYYGKMKLIKGMLSVFIIDLNKNYPSYFKKLVTIFGSRFMKLFRITPAKVKNYYKKTVNSSNNKGSSLVYENIAQTYTEPIPKDILFPIKNTNFEDTKINIPNDADKLLTIGYGDYMKLPPIEDRKIHKHEYIDFGPY